MKKSGLKSFIELLYWSVDGFSKAIQNLRPLILNSVLAKLDGLLGPCHNFHR